MRFPRPFAVCAAAFLTAAPAAAYLDFAAAISRKHGGTIVRHTGGGASFEGRASDARTPPAPARTSRV